MGLVVNKYRLADQRAKNRYAKMIGNSGRDFCIQTGLVAEESAKVNRMRKLASKKIRLKGGPTANIIRDKPQACLFTFYAAKTTALPGHRTQ